jgi:competence protein ComEA
MFATAHNLTELTMIRTLKTSLMASLLALVSAVAMADTDVNKATQAELETLKGIGPTVSGRMLDARKASPFKDWPDLIERVPGIGAGKAAKLSAEGLTVNGSPFKPVAEAPAKRAGATEKAAPVAAAGKK